MAIAQCLHSGHSSGSSESAPDISESSAATTTGGALTFRASTSAMDANATRVTKLSGQPLEEASRKMSTTSSEGPSMENLAIASVPLETHPMAFGPEVRLAIEELINFWASCFGFGSLGIAGKLGDGELSSKRRLAEVSSFGAGEVVALLFVVVVVEGAALVVAGALAESAELCAPPLEDGGEEPDPLLALTCPGIKPLAGTQICLPLTLPQTFFMV